MENREYLNIAHKNLRDTIKYRVENIEGGKIYETNNYLLFTIGVNTDDGHLNGCLSFNDDKYQEIYQAAEKFFNKLGFDYSFWIRDGVDEKLEDLLSREGYEPIRKPGSSIMLTEKRIEDAPLPDGYSLKKVENSLDMEDVAEVIEKAFDKDKIVVDQMFSSRKNLNSESMSSFLVYDEHRRPVSTAITSVTLQSAGIYYVATIEEARSKGIGKAITLASTNAGFDMGKNLVILQASKLGEIIYKKLGFKNIGRYRSYKIKQK